MTLAGWGRAPVVEGREVRSEDLAAATTNVPLTRGLGRAYGDAALPASPDRVVAGSALADRFLAFDASSGLLRAEAGCSLDQLYRVLLPRGFFPPVSPGTRFVTIGGMVAADVHGKNHHVCGSFGRHVTAIGLRVADGAIVECSRERYPELFDATVGGMGLTGHILDVTVQLARVPSPWIYGESERLRDLDHSIEALTGASVEWPMTVAWIDGLSRNGSMGRGILYKGRWAREDEAPRATPTVTAPVRVPFAMPRWLISRRTVAVFDAVNYWKHGSRCRRGIVHPSSFFYPLDVLGDWNLLYGRGGFIQYQCVLPQPDARQSAHHVLEAVSQSGQTPSLCVLKDCGAEGNGLLSFPRPGLSLAIDFQMGPGTQSLVDRLNEIVVAVGGRIYLAKDALTRPEHFRAMEPRLDRFLQVRRQWDPHGRIRSAQSVRLFGW